MVVVVANVCRFFGILVIFFFYVFDTERQNRFRVNQLLRYGLILKTLYTNSLIHK